MARRRAPRSDGRFSRAALFGYDFFISFTLGPPPRGTQAYAADLARQLRARDYTVFFSEDEASPGAVLDDVVKRALQRSRALILIANPAALVESTWTRAEVSEFRRRRRAWPVVPINIDHALEACRDDAEPWLQCEQHIWVNESSAAVADATASRATIDRLAVVPKSVRANKRMRLTLAVVTLLLVTLGTAAGLALNSRAQQQAVAQSRQIAARALDEATRNWSRSILLALAAPLAADSFEARSALLSTVSASGTGMRFLWGHQRAVRTVAFSPDGRLLASGSEDGALYLWDPVAGTSAGMPLKVHGAIRGVAFSPDGQLLASAGEGGVTLWDVATRRPLTEPVTGRMSLSVAFRPDGGTVLSGEEDGSIVLSQVRDRTLNPYPIQAHTKSVLSVAFHPSGDLFASGGEDHEVMLWNIATQKRYPLHGHSREVMSLAFSPDGRLLASGSADETVILWDLRERKPVGAPLRGHDGIVMGLAFSPDGERLVASSYNNRVIVWDLKTGKAVEPLGRRERDGVSSVAFSPDGRLLASGGGNGTVIVSDLAHPAALATRFDAGGNALSSVAFSADGNVIASGTGTNSVLLWNRRTGEPLGAPLMGHEGVVFTVAFSPRDDLLASGDELGRVLLWNVASHSQSGALWGHKGPVVASKFSPDGSLLATGGQDGQIVLWNPATGMPSGEALVMPDGDNVIDMTYSGDGRLLAAGGRNGRVILWDVATRKAVRSPLATDGIAVQGVAFSPDGRLVAAVVNSRAVYLWDVATGQALDPIVAQRANLLSVAFSPDGRLLALGGGETTTAADNKIVLVDVAARRQIGELEQRSRIYKVAFSPDGRTLASASESDGLTLWNVDEGSWRSAACAMVNRSFTPAEWRSVVGEMPFHTVCPEREVSRK